MKDKIRSLDIRLTDLSEYLKISRPTTYKYLDSYEEGNNKQIPKDIFNLFLFIDRPTTKTKEQVITYIMSHFCTPDLSPFKSNIQRYLDDVMDTDYKLIFMNELINSNLMDPIIPYLTECLRILRNDLMSDEDVIQVSRFVIFMEYVSKNMSVSQKEIDLSKRILGVDNNEKQ